MSLALTAVLVMLAQASPDPEALAPRDVELTGKLREATGGLAGKPELRLVVKDRGEYTVYASHAELLGELHRLSGSTVRLALLPEDPRLPKGTNIMVERYEIVDVGGGVVPRIGTIAKMELDGSEQLLFVDTEGNAELLPRGWGKKMGAHVGSKIWMVGTKSQGRFTPMRFQILRTARTGTPE